MNEPESWKPFTSLATTNTRLAEAMLGHLPPGWKGRVLEVGCASGDSLFHLADNLPDAQFVGVDISEANIRSAQERLAQSPHRSRMSFENADYLDFHGGTFDLICSWGVLHFIPGPDATLFGKLAGDLNENGLLLYTLPSDCLFNRCLSFVRKVCRAARFLGLDRPFFELARLVYRRRVSDERLRERIEYMYLPAEHCESPALKKQRKALSLEHVAEESEPHPSLAALKLRLFVLRKSSPASRRAQAA